MGGYIYLTQNLINGKKYIGKRHGYSNKTQRYLGSGKLLLKAISKYGKENFSKRVLIEGAYTKQQLCTLEKKYIAKHKAVTSKSFYNILEGGQSIAGGHNKIQVYKYHFSGKLLSTYPSIKEAARKNNMSPESFWQVMKKQSYSKSGDIYSTNPCFEEIDPIQYKTVYQYSEDGKIINTFRFGRRQVQKVLRMRPKIMTELLSGVYSKKHKCYFTENINTIKPNKYIHYQSVPVKAYSTNSTLDFVCVAECARYFNTTDKTIRYRSKTNIPVNGYTIQLL